MNVSTVEAGGLHETRDPGCRSGHALQVVTGIGRGAGADAPARHPARILTCDPFAARHSIALGAWLAPAGVVVCGVAVRWTGIASETHAGGSGGDGAGLVGSGA